MIVKNLSRKTNGGQLLRYVFRYVLEKDKKNIYIPRKEKDKPTLILKHNIRSRSVEGYIREFKENESYRLIKRKDSVILHHTILSFSNKDKEHVTDSILKSVSKKYIELRGRNCLHVAVKHADREHTHCHIITSGVQLNGRSSRISKQKFYSIKLSLNEFQRQKFPFLTNSLPEHGKRARLNKEGLIKKIKAERQTNKESIISSLEKIFNSSISKEQFLSKLEQKGFSIYTRNEKIQGIKSDNIKYRFSRLGFDEDRLKFLNKANEQLSELNEIRNNRSQIGKETAKPVISETEPSESNPNFEEKALNELADIRENENEREYELEYEGPADVDNEDSGSDGEQGE